MCGSSGTGQNVVEHSVHIRVRYVEETGLRLLGWCWCHCRWCRRRWWLRHRLNRQWRCRRWWRRGFRDTERGWRDRLRRLNGLYNTGHWLCSRRWRCAGLRGHWCLTLDGIRFLGDPHLLEYLVDCGIVQVEQTGIGGGLLERIFLRDRCELRRSRLDCLDRRREGHVRGRWRRRCSRQGRRRHRRSRSSPSPAYRGRSRGRQRCRRLWHRRRRRLSDRLRDRFGHAQVGAEYLVDR